MQICDCLPVLQFLITCIRFSISFLPQTALLFFLSDCEGLPKCFRKFKLWTLRREMPRRLMTMIDVERCRSTKECVWCRPQVDRLQYMHVKWRSVRITRRHRWLIDTGCSISRQSPIAVCDVTHRLVEAVFISSGIKRKHEIERSDNKPLDVAYTVMGLKGRQCKKTGKFSTEKIMGARNFQFGLHRFWDTRDMLSAS